MKIVLIRSKRRRKTVAARVNQGVLELRIPFWLPKYKAEQIAQKFLKKIKRRRVKKDSDSFLKKRTAVFNKKYFGGRLEDFSIGWSNRQKSAFGICDSGKREIRISFRVKKMPSWVVDYLVIHELAHLLVPAHNKKFWKLVKQYPGAKEARAFLRGVRYGELGKV
ncbi:M48 family metallopeptidase [Patescibacteria group bacterium]|nr:M48 family metallopeptidase [Patescibacteria group bacterium]